MSKATGVSAAVLAIIAAVFAVEGGYVNDRNDPGGETNHGITKQVAVAHGYRGSMKDLPVHLAQAIYYKDYIEAPGYLPLVELQPAVATKVIDAAVNAGAGRSSRWFQQSLNALGRGGKDFPQIYVDGRVGSSTIKTYVLLEKVRGKRRACELVLKAMDGFQAAHYLSLTKLNKFTVGWLDNRIGNVPVAQCKE